MFKFKRHGERRHARDAYWDESPRGRHPHWKHEHQHGRRGRFFDQGDLRLIMLSLIAEAPRHGYEIIKLIEDKLAGAYSPSPGVVYPTLTLLEELGYATVGSSDGGKKLYSITPEGNAFLATNRATIDALQHKMAKIGDQQGAPAPQVQRAIENLRSALRLRIGRGGLSETSAQKIADALDAAAKAIEQS
jgi:DNA-binding PadR family transcriptional regulator